MSRIFISHSSKNNAEARAIRDWLISNGWNDYFLDLDPERGIVAGERWERALHEAANRCQAVLFLVSRAWLESDWCEKEMMLAHKLDKPMFGVIIDDKVTIETLPSKLKAYWQAVDLAQGRDGVIIPTLSEDRTDEQHVTFSENGLRRLKAGLDSAGLDASFFPWPPKDEPGRSPYRGLKPLEAVDAGIFFGRDGLIVEALDGLRRLREAAAPRLLVTLGASGTGKSSFLRAGIIPRLDRDDRRFLVLPPIRAAFGAINGEAGLVQAFDTTATKINLKKDRATIRAAVEAGDKVLSDLVQEICIKAKPPVSQGDPDIGLPTLVIPIDQGEELFAGEALPETAVFLKRLVELLHLRDADKGAIGVNPSATTLAIITIRSDAYERLQTSPMFSAVAHTPFSVGPMTEVSFKDVVVGPVEMLNRNTNRKLKLKQDFIDTLLRDVIKDGGPDKMPLLAFVMERMFFDHGGDDLITLAEYLESGGVGGAIEKAVNDALATLAGTPKIPKRRDAVLALLRQMLIPQLAVVDPATREPQSRPALRSDLPAEGLPLIDALVAKRLLTSDAAPDGEQARLQIAHEALLRQWQPMSEWLRADGEAIAMLRRARDSAREWDVKGRLDDWLQHSGTLLDRTSEHARLREMKSLLSGELVDYLAACQVRDQARQAEDEARNAEKEAAAARQLADARRIAEEQGRAFKAAAAQIKAEKEARWRTLIGAAVAAVLAVLAIMGGVFAWYQQGQASEKATIAARNETISLTALSTVAAQNGQYRDALMLALAAWPRVNDRDRPPLRRTFDAFNVASPKVREQLRLQHYATIYSAAFSPDGQRIVTASIDGTARLWDAATGTRVGNAMKHEGEVRSAAFSPDGQRIVTASLDDTARLWDAATGTRVGKAMKHEGEVRSAAFSPDGQRIVTASDDKTARLWDVATGTPIGEAMKHEGWVNSAAFSPDGQRVVTASLDGTARLWDAATGTPVGEAMKHEGVISAAFSPDGQRVLTASLDETARLWDVATTTPIGEAMKHDGEVRSAAFSPDGQRVVTAFRDGIEGGTARLWDATTGAPVGEAMKHEGEVRSAAFSPDGQRIVTASHDKTARLWDAATGTPIGEAMKHEGEVRSAAFSPDGQRVVTASLDGTARLWDVAIGTPIGEAMKHEGVISAAFSPDGQRIVTASLDDTARLWDAATGTPIGEAMKHEGVVWDAAFSPDGQRVVTASEDDTARLWDAATGTPIGEAMKHEGVVWDAAFSPDGQRVVTASDDGTARLWDAATGTPIGEAMKHEGEVISAAFSPDGKRIVTASIDSIEGGTARLWDAATGAPVGEAMKHEDRVNSAAFSPDGKRVVTASVDGTARLWDAATGAPVGEAMKHDGWVNSAAFSPDGQRVVTASDDKTARLWDAATGTPIGEATKHDGGVISAAFSPDGKRLVTASRDGIEGGTARLWDATTGARVSEVVAHSGYTIVVAFSPDGKIFVLASGPIAQIFHAPDFGDRHGFAIGCAVLGPQTDLAEIEKKYGLKGLKPICGGNEPAPIEASKLQI